MYTPCIRIFMSQEIHGKMWQQWLYSQNKTENFPTGESETTITL